MPKQTIEINAPDDKEITNFIEVRDYLHRGSNGYILHNSIQRNLCQQATDIEALPYFIKWLDDDWRKIYI